MDNPFELITANQERIIALLEQIAGGAAPEEKTPAKRTPAKKAPAKEPAITKGQATDAVNKVKSELGTPAAKKIMTDNKVAKLADMTPDQIEPVYKAAMEALAAAALDEEEEEEEDL